MRAAVHLPVNSAIQSIFTTTINVAKQMLARPSAGPVTRQRVTRLAIVYCATAGLGAALSQTSWSPSIQTFGLGLTFPGAGFLAWDGPTASPDWAIAGLAASMTVFAASLILWFATGNVLAPIAAWLLAALTAGFAPSASTIEVGDVIVGLAPASALLIYTVLLSPPRATRKPDAPTASFSPALAPPQEISISDLQRMRLLLDRALQPVDQFCGFEWADQFQTAAVR